MMVLDATVVNVALPDIQASLGFSATALAWVLSAYTLTFGGLLLLGGRMGDILGRRRVFMAGIALFTAASLVGGLATEDWWLLAARALQGVGAAMASPTALALITTNFEEGPMRTRAFSLFAAVSGSGSALGLLLGGMLTSWTSWRWVLFINVPIGLAMLILTPRFIKESDRHPGRFDLVGAITSTLGMTSLVYGFLRAADHGWSDGQTLPTLSAGVILLGLFVFNETRAKQPITPIRLFRNRNRTGSYLVMILSAASIFSMFYFLIQFLQEVLNFSALRAGLAFLPLTVAIMTAATIAGRVVTQVSPRVLLVVGTTLAAVGLGWLSQLEVTSGYLWILWPVLVTGLGCGLVFVPLILVALSGVAESDSGAASGLLDASQQVGSSVGLAILVTVFGTAARDAGESPPAHITDPETLGHYMLAEGSGAAFMLATGFAICGLLASLMLINAKAGDLDPEAAVSRGM
jgi:EmrB/QacA subfamily drug resistance transporter